MRTQLWRDKNAEQTYENTIEVLKASDFGEYRLFISILGEMFNQMRNIYTLNGSPLSNGAMTGNTTSVNFLYQFDAIFTLNQDTLLEQHYLTEYFYGQSGGHWRGWDMPGIHDVGERLGNNPFYTATTVKEVEEDDEFSLRPNHQLYLKLHGSHNWVTKSGLALITGGNKAADIGTVLPSRLVSHAHFKAAVCDETARLMIIGYGFGDRHINSILLRASAAGGRFFIVDTQGISVIDKRKSTDQLAQRLWPELAPNIIGASRRPLASTFNSDHIEHSKLQEFFTA